MAKMFNNHFLQVGQILEKNIGPTNRKYDDYLNHGKLIYQRLFPKTQLNLS